MKVFKPSDLTHTLRIIPRVYVAAAILMIRHELTGNVVSITVSCVEVNGYLLAEFEYVFKEGGSYEITVNTVMNELLYRGKAYATDEVDLQNYKLTK